MAKGKKKTKFIPIDQIGNLESKKTEERVNTPQKNVEESTTTTETTENQTITKSNSPSPKPNNKKKKKENVVKDEKEDFSSCIICTEDVELYAVGSCNHPICHRCSLRLRILYETKECPYCKTELNNVIYTKNKERQYEDYRLSDFSYFNKDRGSYFENEDIRKIVNNMEKYCCPDDECSFVGDDWMSLKKHTKNDHDKFLCDICINKKKVFPFEQILYSQDKLIKHKEKEHKQCGFCMKRFYDDDDLYDHCKKSYEECQCCKQLGKPNQYFINYGTLSEHFNKEHFVCQHPECLEKKFIVFPTEFDLKAHEVEEHLQNSGKGKGRYQPIDIGFQYADSHSSSSNYHSRNDRNDRYNNRNNRNNRNDGNDRRERNNRNGRKNRSERNNDEHTTTTTNEIIGNDETSQKSNQRSNNRSKKNNNNNNRGARNRFNVPEGFGSKLTGSENDAKNEEEIIQESSSSSHPIEASHSNNRQSKASASSSSSHSATTTITSMDPEEIELIKKLNKMIGSDQNQITTFKTISSSYYKDLLPAEKFLEAFIALVNKNDVKGKGKKKNVIDKIGSVWNQMAKDLLKKKDSPEGKNIDFEKKCNDMLRAWNDYKIKQNDQEEDYSTILAEKKKKLNQSYASHADLPDSLGLLSKPKQKAKVLVIKSSSKTTSPVASRNHSTDNLGSAFYDRIAERMIQLDKKQKQKENEKVKFVLESESSANNSSASESESEESEVVTASNSNAAGSSSVSTNQERNNTTINTPTSKTVVDNATRYLKSSKHKMNKYNSDFPSLSGSSSSAASALFGTSLSNNNNNNNPYDRSSQKNRFKPMSQKLKSQEEFPSLQSTNRNKKNTQIKQPRAKSSVLRIV
ncbi:hypothetical protein BCR36DRAFT_330993 [Piromyces finnis]|uniref:RING-type E3 ubiquitin transferase n=1 Tax=Piromyces finnis TaxID=1754191 RepID=A0A1Y1V4Z2_9FUNG|nr:hypothetical protein BCR36DRAFT_330993 [Piromyces finnis]|eukprot:ORX46852.1 hypothetical protein BCR36DRAFT_330993 [Piromyces finnis]